MSRHSKQYEAARQKKPGLNAGRQDIRMPPMARVLGTKAGDISRGRKDCRLCQGLGITGRSRHGVYRKCKCARSQSSEAAA